MRKRAERLTETERRVGRLMLDGLSVREIARRLGLCVMAVQIHGFNVCQKTRAWSRREMQKRQRYFAD